MRRYKWTFPMEDDLPWYIELFQRRRRVWALVNCNPNDDTILAAAKNRKDLEAYLSELDNWYDEIENPYPWFIACTYLNRPVADKVVRWWTFSGIRKRRRDRIRRKRNRVYRKQLDRFRKHSDDMLSEIKENHEWWNSFANYYGSEEEREGRSQ